MRRFGSMLGWLCVAPAFAAGWYGRQPSAPLVTNAAEPIRVPLAARAQPAKPRDWARVALASSVMIYAGKSCGAGVVVGARRAILTVAHLVEGQSRIKVRPIDGPPVEAQVVAIDPALDLAILEAKDWVGTPATPMPSATLEAGDALITVGAPENLAFSISRGSVASPNRQLLGLTFIQTDFPAHPGNSGGPISNDQGGVVGVMSFVLQGRQGIAFGIPIEYAFARFPEWLGADEALSLEGFEANRR